jgi:YgiT-type zinc finger domain-containing protein
MNKKRRRTDLKICSQCRQPSVLDVLRTRAHKGVVIENIPATYCPNCGEELYDLATMEAVERIVANPDRYARIQRMVVADFKAAA